MIKTGRTVKIELTRHKMDTYQARQDNEGAWAFYELRTSQYNWGPKNGHFWKTNFRYPNINAMILN